MSADNVKIDILSVLNGQVNTERNFIVAHSLGGLVARTMGQLQNSAGGKAYDGLITFGTPHLGVKAANTLVNSPEKLDMALTKACQALGRGPALENILNLGALARTAINFGFAGAVLDFGCEAGVDVGFPALLEFASAGLEAELTTTSAPSIPPMVTGNKAAFYGIELDDNESLAPRFLGAILNPPTSFDLYQAGASDGLGLATFGSELENYDSKLNFWKNKHAPFWLWLTCPECAAFKEEEYRRIEDGYRKGVNWFPTFNPTWKSLIGALDLELEQTGCQCDYYDYGDLVNSSISNASQGEDCEQYSQYENTWSVDCNPYYELVAHEYDCDGFVLAESAMNAPGVNYEVQFMPGSNHLQMRNDGEMEKAVKLIFEHGIDERTFFQTQMR